jgi:hypothetical protein
MTWLASADWPLVSVLGTGQFAAAGEEQAKANPKTAHAMNDPFQLICRSLMLTG